MIPVGKYKARATEGALGFTSTGKEQVAVALEVQSGEYQGKEITWYGYFTDATTDRTLESLRHLGWKGDDLSDLTGILDNEVQIVVEEETDQQGEVRTRVRWINGGGGVAMKDRMTDADAKAFAGRMKGHILAQRRASGAAQPQQQRQPSREQGGFRQQSPRGNQAAFGEPMPDDKDAF